MRRFPHSDNADRARRAINAKQKARRDVNLPCTVRRRYRRRLFTIPFMLIGPLPFAKIIKRLFKRRRGLPARIAGAF